MMQLRKISPHKLYEKLMATPDVKACGLDAWTVAELKKLPFWWWERLADMLDLIEQGATWPEPLLTGYLSFIDKGAGAAALDQRPLTILSLVYRLWASIRLEEINPWVRTWMHLKCAAVEGKGPEDVWGSIASKLEAAKERKCPLAGIAVDLKKCFDLVPRHLAIRVLTEMGADPRLTTALESFYSSMRRRIRIGSALGEFFSSTSSIIQGDPLAMLLLLNGLLLPAGSRN